MQTNSNTTEDIKQRVENLLGQMTLEEKVGQLNQLSGAEGHIPEHLRVAIQQGKAGSVINENHPETVNQLQHIAINESRLGIPLLIGRDVIHGFKTIFPIPLGQAASWSPEVVKKGAQIAATEAKVTGINWTFAPMIDISRDPRWGRIAESLGEDPYLCAELGKAMVSGFQGDNFSQPFAIAACAKHFCGYGAAESGRDYCTTNIPENELRNVYLEPFKAASEANVATIMTSFSDLDGIPASGNRWLLDEVLHQEWDFQGFVASDWESISQLTIHGLCEDSYACAETAFDAGVAMEMVSTTYRDHLAGIVANSKTHEDKLDDMVRRILTLKFRLGLFDSPPVEAHAYLEELPQAHLNTAKDAAIQSCVLLKNDNKTLPLCAEQTNTLTLIGPLADDGYEQLGTWIFDGEEKHSTTILQGIYSEFDGTVHYHRAMDTSRSHQINELENIKRDISQSDAVVLVLGEEAILSGEAHCRAELNLPGCQEELIKELVSCGKSLILVILAGRPLTLGSVIPDVDALLFCWHPGTMAGPAIADLLFGKANPSGKLPVSFPRKVGQIPIYYSQKTSGKPVTEDNFVHLDDIPVRAAQTSLGMAASHLDTHFTPQFPFGFGLSYSQFNYHSMSLSDSELNTGKTLEARVQIHNDSDVAGFEIVQLYIQDLFGSITRPPKELKGFQKVYFAAGESKTVSFVIHHEMLAFYGKDKIKRAEPGEFKVWIGADSTSGSGASFRLVS
ncbi:glycoside hydrolase family 3 N-terminal domain-containing protein [Planctobacterium marinum]|uniref:beta-glucosidase n=1 Tax=Planctobacterium marinum TaxID=1631968 RepID=A0AA48KPX7_9ALTE|nr:beta-glucosidase [Planctobacterium marinum]